MKGIGFFCVSAVYWGQCFIAEVVPPYSSSLFQFRCFS